ncbi:MAG: vitamin K epoxide reductase family protein [Chloroflexia bacterium]
MLLALALPLALRPPLSQAQETPTTYPTRTPKACHICDEEEVALTTRLAATPTLPAVTSPAQFGEAVVHALLFWMDTCPHCHEVIENILAPLQARYGLRLDIRLVEIKTQEQFQQLLPVASCYGIPQEYFGVPFLVIGEHGLLGSGQIAAELPGLIEDYLAAGGVGLPDSPCLQKALQAANIDLCQPGEENCTAVAPTAVPPPSGLALAVAVLVGMIGALVLGGVLAARAWQVARPRPAARHPRRPAPLPWTAWLFPFLTLGGLAVAGYLAYVEMRGVPAVCGPVGDCNAVQQSDYALLLGFLPVGLLGVLGYIAILAAWLWGRFGRGRLARWAQAALLGLTLFGTLFSLYLTCLEIFVIRAICSWCLTSAAIMTVLFLLSTRPAVRALRVEGR